MVTRFSCPCGTKLKAPDESVRKRVLCPSCGTWLRVPLSSSYETVARKSRRQSPAPGSANGAPPAHKARIVVAMGPGPERTWMETTLREHGYGVILADDGPQAVERIRAEKPDAAIVDFRLEGFGGFQVVQQVRDPVNPKNQAIWHIPIIITADRLRGRDKQYAISIGANAFLARPLTPALLCSRLEKEMAREAPRRP